MSVVIILYSIYHFLYILCFSAIVFCSTFQSHAEDFAAFDSLRAVLNREVVSNSPLSPSRSFVVKHLDDQEIRQLQTNLKKLDLYDNAIDGIAGRQTQLAVLTLRKSVNLDPGDGITKADLIASEYEILRRSRPGIDESRIATYIEISNEEARLGDEFDDRLILDTGPTHNTTYEQTFRTASRTASTDTSEDTANSNSETTREEEVSAARLRVVPTRAFAASGEYPPEGYRGYGLIAFKSLATEFDIKQHRFICAAYIASYQHSRSSKVGAADQFLTLWPVRTNDLSRKLNIEASIAKAESCETAILGYDLSISYSAINAAKKAGFSSDGTGPFLLAWSPGEAYGKEDTFVISLDLSSVGTYRQALQLMSRWREEVEANESFKKSVPPRLERLRSMMRAWSDKYGDQLLQISVN